MGNVKEFMLVKYESLVDEGILPILQKIEALTGMASQCDNNIKAAAFGGLETLDEGLIHWLNDNADWGIEGNLGYKKGVRPYASLLSQTIATNETNKIERIALLGERNTGSRWVTKKLRECYPEVKVCLKYRCIHYYSKH